MNHAKSQGLKAKVVLARLLIGLASVTVYSQTSFAQSTNAPASGPVRLTFEAFRTIGDRNIFNPNRYARSAGRTAPRTSSQPAARVESFSLVGIMAYEKGWFAFFEGTKSDYKQALQVDGAIGEYKVVSVSPEQVKLRGGTNSYDLKVGMQMRREDEGDWFLSEGGDAPRKRMVSTRTRTRGGARGESAPGDGTEEMTGSGEPEVIVIENPAAETTEGESPAGNDNGNGAPAPAEAEPGNGGVTDPVLLRLMQRRQQMNQ